uniref:HEAT repeat-containing protein 1 n=1 Tax=Romanomermis culicivorax TaxID=13658 RepID=A0A915IYE5_ROMCU
MTSLSQQLKKLALPETRVFKLDKKRASFLFEAKDAAGIDRQTFFDIGCSGFDELRTIDENFQQFKQHLFNDSSVGVQRAVMSREANDDLNATLDKFLLLLTPYFTLKSAHKAVEWLIYRFNIHQYNIDSVIRCILPYHHTNIFIRMLQILEFDETNGLWYWLLPIRKSGKPLPRQTLLNHCTSDLGFLRFLCECTSGMVETCTVEELERLQVLFTFFTSVICGVIGSGQKVNDGLIGQILPYVILGLRSRIQSFNIASFMIISQISITLKLKTDVCNSLVKQIFSKLRPPTIEYATSTVVVLFQSQQIPSIKTKVLVKLLKKLESGSIDFIDCLRTLNSSTNIDNFLSKLIISSVQAIISPEDGMLDLARLSLNRGDAGIDEEILELGDIVDSVEETPNQVLEDLWSKESLYLIDCKLWPIDGASLAVSAILKQFEYLFAGLANNGKTTYAVEMEAFLKVMMPCACACSQFLLKYPPNKEKR